MEEEGSIDVIVSVVGIGLGFFSLATHRVWERDSTKSNNGTFWERGEWTTSSSMLF